MFIKIGLIKSVKQVFLDVENIDILNFLHFQVSSYS